MSDANPYSAPDASLDTGDDELYQPKVFSFNGRIGRMRFLAYSIGINLVLTAIMIPLAGASMFMGGDPSSSMIGMLGIGVFYLVTIVISVMFSKRRLNDLNRSGWWFLLFIIPIVNLFFAIYLIFFPGSSESNKFGAAPVPNTVGVLILAWMFPAIMILGIVAAIVIPQFAGMAPQ